MSADDLMDERRLLPATLADRLRQEISTGAIPPDTRLRQAEIAERFNVSTTPVREAFVMLEREGLVRNLAYRGVVVFRPTVADLREIYEMRIALEGLAAELAVPNLSEKDLADLAGILGKLRAANAKNDRVRSRDLNDQFHNRIYAACDRPRLTALVTELRQTSAGYRQVFTNLVFNTDPEDLHRTELEHEKILRACVAKASKQAGKETTTHLRHTLVVVDNYLKTTAANDALTPQ